MHSFEIVLYSKMHLVTISQQQNVDFCNNMELIAQEEVRIKEKGCDLSKN